MKESGVGFDQGSQVFVTIASHGGAGNKRESVKHSKFGGGAGCPWISACAERRTRTHRIRLLSL